MVFTSLNDREKQAFFNLLDEYFSSRPDLLSGNAASSGNTSSTAPNVGVAAARKAFMNNPEATAGLVSAGLRAASASQHTTQDDTPRSTFGRVAAASAAFNNSPSKPIPPPTLPRRTSPTSASISPPPQAPAQPARGGGTSNLTTSRKFGDVDLSSTKNALFSLRGSTAAKTAPPPQVAPSIPSAFPKKANTFAPPPIRRLGTDDSNSSSALSRNQPVEQEQEPEPEVLEEDGEWAEALYDYTSEDPGDLHLQANQRIKVVERTSGDWWTGEVEGRRGLFPASYVRLL